MTITITKCDIKNCKEKDARNTKLQVIFTTNGLEGKPCSPYIEHHHIDICKECFSKILSGAVIFAYGAQGHNTYEIKG